MPLSGPFYARSSDYNYKLLVKYDYRLRRIIMNNDSEVTAQVRKLKNEIRFRLSDNTGKQI
jgi:hypothetical protein